MGLGLGSLGRVGKRTADARRVYYICFVVVVFAAAATIGLNRDQVTV